MTRDAFLALIGRNYIPGEPMCESDVIAAMITNGHTQGYAEGTIRTVQRGYWAPGERPHTESMACHTVRWHPYAGGHFTYIGH